jgi:hypothetical protein
MSIDHILPSRNNFLDSVTAAMTPSFAESGDLPRHTAKMGYPKSNIQVNLDNHFGSKVYTSTSPVTGHVAIMTRRDVRFDTIEILLVGRTKTRVDGVNAAQEVSHTFLKMVMPISESTYPVPRILQSGQTYTIPFDFVIPNYLTVHACNHKIQSDQLLDQHVLLPPTMGTWEKDDMAPEMAHVEYSVRARVFRQSDLEKPQIKVMEASQNIQVLPTSTEEAPLNITKHDRIYTMEKSKTLRKGFLSGKLGRLTAEATQPGAAFVRPDGLAVSGTAAQIELKFDPASADIVPPKVTGVTGKVIAHTYYSSSGISTLPNLGDWTREAVNQRRGAYTTSAPLPAVNISKARWAQHLVSDIRRDSGYSTQGRSQADSDSDHEIEKPSPRGRRSHGSERTKTTPSSPIFHTTTLRVPINLRLDKKTFIPTFHSCIASRFYTVQLSLSLSSGSTTHSVTLTLPLQVAVASDLMHGTGLPSFESAVEEAAADDYLAPRVIQVPDHQYTATSVLPGYGERTAAR